MPSAMNGRKAAISAWPIAFSASPSAPPGPARSQRRDCSGARQCAACRRMASALGAALERRAVASLVSIWIARIAVTAASSRAASAWPIAATITAHVATVASSGRYSRRGELCFALDAGAPRGQQGGAAVAGSWRRGLMVKAAGLVYRARHGAPTAGSSSTSRSGWARPRRSARSSARSAKPGEPKTKVGHGGTLDPLASGVLPIALGEATKLAGRMLDATKAYDFTIRFGEETDTLDLEGEVIATSDVRPTAPRSKRSCRASPARSSRSRRLIRR